MNKISAMISAGLFAVVASGLAAGGDTREAKAVAEIKHLGGTVTLDDKSPDKPVTGVNFSHVFGLTDAGLASVEPLTHLQSLNLEYTIRITNSGLEHLRGLAGLETLSLKSTQVGDAGLEFLAGLTELRSLNLYYTKVTDAGLAQLKGLKRLKQLDLTDTQVTDAGLKHLEGLANLESLDLGVTKVTDAGLAHIEGLTQLRHLDLACQLTDVGLVHLKGLKQLQSLNLADTKVTDAGLEHLKALPNLRYVRLFFDKVTAKGVKELQQALPNCKIDSDYDTTPRPAELKVLEKLVGTWNSEGTETRGKKECRVIGTMTAAWILDGHFIQCRGMRNPGGIQNLQVIGFDPVEKEYRMWYFDSSGSVTGPVVGHWDDNSKTLAWRVNPNSDVVLLNEVRFVDSNTIESHLVISSKDGTVLFEQRAKSTRKK
jgi:hypothetical protein